MIVGGGKMKKFDWKYYMKKLKHRLESGKKKIHYGFNNLKFRLKTVPQGVRTLPKRKIVIGVYISIIIVLVGFVFFRAYLSPSYEMPETTERQDNKQENEVIDMEDVFESALEEAEEQESDDKEAGLEGSDMTEGEEHLIPVQEDEEQDIQDQEAQEKDTEEAQKDKEAKEDENKTTTVSAPEEVPEAVWPVEGEILTEHGEMYQVNNQYRFHNGIDIKETQGAEIIAAWDGQVEKVEQGTALGQQVKITSNGFSAVYANLEEVLVSKGDEVEQGEPIATVGNSAKLGAREGHYLHFAVYIGYNSIDPKEVLPR